MNHWLKKGCVVLAGLLITACEDATLDYSADIVGSYIVETAIIDGVNTNYGGLPIEEGWIIDITKDNLLSYENDLNQCDSTFDMEARVIDSVTDTAIVFEDNTSLYYSKYNGQLTLSNEDDIIILVEYGSVFPPLSWTDPSYLTNDVYEPDAGVHLATRISAAGAIQSHYSAVCDDDDYFIFEALEGTSYIIEAEAAIDSDIDLTISLFYENGDSVGYNDDQATSNVDPLLEWTCENGGDYYFIISKYWDYLDPGNSLDDEKGAYTISVDVTKQVSRIAPQNTMKDQKLVPSRRPPHHILK